MNHSSSSTTVAALLLGLLIAIGCATAGYFIGNGALRFRSDIRTVTVKGLVEREVASDLAIWSVGFRRTGDDLGRIRDELTGDRAAVLAFLAGRGFKDAEIERAPMRVTDKLAREYGSAQANAVATS